MITIHVKGFNDNFRFVIRTHPISLIPEKNIDKYSLNIVDLRTGISIARTDLYNETVIHKVRRGFEKQVRAGEITYKIKHGIPEKWWEWEVCFAEERIAVMKGSLYFAYYNAAISTFNEMFVMESGGKND